MDNTKELFERPIPGITVKNLIAVAVFFSGCVIGYIDIKNGQTRNYELMFEMKKTKPYQMQTKKLKG